MTLNEKLEQFYKSAVDSATSQNLQIVDEYKKSLQKIYDDHKEDVTRKSDIAFRAASENLIREKNITLSTDTMDLKRKINEKAAELTEKIFKEVYEMLLTFIKTPDYVELLATQITAANTFARGEEVTFYINSSDESLKAELESKTGITLTISTIDFIGGTRAVIHKQNILIDNSFLTKLEESKNSFML